MHNFADWIAVGFWLEGERDAKERRPAFIHRKFRGLLAFESHKHPRYTLLLPDGSIGWVQVIVNDPKR
jgi:hypothetical protein